jgi:polysaccharide chain length determinant protein (PEP-CTERM system associated)
MEEQQVHALDYVAVVRRRRWWLVGPIALSFIVGILLVRFLPKEYKSSTTLGVAAPIVSPSLVSQSSSLNTDDRVRAISLQLLSLPILERVLKDETQGSRETELQIIDLQRGIEITVPDPVASGTGQKRLDTFVVSYSDEDPVRAQRIANRLATIFVDENSKSRTERAEDTSMFIATQLRTSQARLADLEARLRQSKEAHMGQLPEQTQANLQMLAGLRQQFEANATSLRGEQDRLTMVERQIEAYRQDAETALASKGRDAATPEARVVTLQQELAAARATYTAKHPEVIRLEGELAAARKDLAEDRSKPLSEQTARATDPAYRQLLQDRDATRLRVAEIQRSGSDIQRQIGVYQSRVEAAPMVEQQLATVQRDYDLEKQQYSDLSAKLHSASIAESVERNRSGEQFTIVYPASYPLTPTKPVLWRLMLIVIAAGAVTGATLAFGREYLDRSVHDARTLKDEFEVRVLGEIAHIHASRA